jgi:GNAT superfamily N-acetyltransferase
VDRGASILNVRNATRDDIEALVSLRIQLLEATDPSFDGALRAWLRTHLADGSFRAWIADDAGTVVAASGLTVLDRPPYPGNATGLDGYVTNMYTLPAYRRRGLARQLLEVLTAHAPPGRGQAAVPGSESRGPASLRLVWLPAHPGEGADTLASDTPHPTHAAAGTQARGGVSPSWLGRTPARGEEKRKQITVLQPWVAFRAY